jgi:putative transport protein
LRSTSTRTPSLAARVTHKRFELICNGRIFAGRRIVFLHNTMDWIIALFTQESVAHAVIALSIVIALGLGIGAIRVFGIKLGMAGVLFSGLALGHFGMEVNHEVLEFIREFGLILFVFAIGLMVGPGFLASFKRQGLSLNMLAATTVLLGSLITFALYKFASVPLPAAVGLLSGATTNTPSLAAAGQALRQFPDTTPEMLTQPGLAYAVAYPFGIIGTILAMIIVRLVFRINIGTETKALEDARKLDKREVHAVTLEVQNPNLFGATISRIPGLIEGKAIISRHHRDGVSQLARPDTTLQRGDLVTVVAPDDGLEKLRLAIGSPTKVVPATSTSPLTARRVLVTKENVLGKGIDELALFARFDVNVTRVSRAGEDFTATSELTLQFGDVVTIVGHEDGVRDAATALGDSAKELNHPRLAPIFVGIALGVLAGSIPFAIPGLPAALKLGLAGGPLLIAIILSRIGHLGPLVWYMPPSANHLMREMGIALFLACVGLRAGGSFFEVVLNGDGLRWMLLGTIVTLVPILVVGFIGRAFLKLNYVSLCGVIAGSMTDPPALAFAQTVTGSEATSVAYATVYPLTMILRVFAAQLLVLAFLH